MVLGDCGTAGHGKWCFGQIRRPGRPGRRRTLPGFAVLLLFLTFFSLVWVKADAIVLGYHRFGARLLYPDRYIPGSFGIYVSELGWSKGIEKDGIASIPNDRPLTRRVDRVMISAREKGTNRTALRFWMVFSE